MGTVGIRGTITAHMPKCYARHTFYNLFILTFVLHCFVLCHVNSDFCLFDYLYVCMYALLFYICTHSVIGYLVVE